jgi:hypothetical protein
MRGLVRTIAMAVGVATLAIVVAAPRAVGLGTQSARLTPGASSGAGFCQPASQSGTTGVTVIVPVSTQGPDDSVAQSCTYVSLNGGHNAQTWNSNTPNTFTITVNDGNHVVEVEHHGDLANVGDQVVDQGAFTAPRGSVVTVTLLNGCPQPGACGSFGTVSSSAPDAPGSPSTTSGSGRGGRGGGGAGGPGTITVASFGAVSGAALGLTSSCAGGGACTGGLEVDATAVKRHQKKHKKQPTLVIVAKGSYSVPTGTTVTVTLVLTKQGKVLLKEHHGRLATTLKITPTGGKATTQSLKLMQKKRKKG